MLGERIDPDTVVVHASERGNLKQALLKIGWPAEDYAGYVDGEAHPIDLDESDWTLRDYQREAAESFWHGGSGVVVLPCGAGKTLVGASAMAHAKATTLILVTNTVSARQWKDELVRRTSLTEDEIGEYSGAVKEVRPVTIATYQVLTHEAEGRLPPPRAARRPRLGPDRLRRGAPAARADLPDDRRPAGAAPDRADRHPGARGRPRGRRVLADRAQAVRRALEGHRVAGLDRPGRLRRGAGHAARRRAPGLRHLRARGALPHRLLHPPQDRGGARAGRAPRATSRPWSSGSTSSSSTSSPPPSTPPSSRARRASRSAQRLFDAFRSGEERLLVVSKVANFSIDLPDAEVAIQVSGSFGSRQEEAQRLGRAAAPGPRRQGRRASTPSSRATPSTPSSPRTASGSWPSRATPTGSSTPRTSPT